LDAETLAQPLDAVLFTGPADSLRALLAQLAQRPGPIVNVYVLDAADATPPAEALWAERSVSTNTAAAGGNASLMMLAN
jgi:RHH-type proline utilization regulon transcriptional repressor/proline dehydrogenase/delta 1-pyrroline-5-carboxylate dehydrogenase